MFEILSINNTLFTLFGYQMSYIEFFGTILNILSVYLVARNNIWTWPIGNVAVVLFAVLFYQINLYSDVFEQIYFIITGFYGWWIWSNFRNKSKDKDSLVVYNSKKSNVIYFIFIVVGTVALGYLMSNIHIYLPKYFPEPASFAYIDAFTTVMSFAATILMAHKKIECWYLWILVDIIGIGLYFTKGVVFISFLYLVFLVLATNGLFNWRKLTTKRTI